MEMLLSILFLITPLVVCNPNETQYVGLAASYGVLTLVPEVPCNITTNGTTVEYNGTIPGLHYGLITYDCDGHRGYVLSKPKCFECGIYCPYNEHILECKQFWAPMLMGVAIAIVVCIVLTIFWLYCVGPRIDDCLIKYSKYRNERKVKRIVKIEKHLEERGAIPPKNEYMEMIDSPTPSAPEKDDLPPVPPLVPSRPTMYPDLDKKEIMSKPTFVPVKRKVGGLTSTATTLLLLCVMFPVNKACDQTLFMSSNGQICDKSKCQDVNTYSFGFDNKKTVCFRSIDGDMVTFKMTDPSIIVRYMLVYKTARYDIEVESTWNCRSAGYCYSQYCHLGAKHPDFSGNSSLTGFDCFSESLACESYCYHRTACTWVKYEIRPDTKHYNVYEIVSSYWSFDLLVTKSNYTTKYNFNTNKPSHYLSISELFKHNSLPMTATNMDKMDYAFKNNIIKVDDEYIEINACDLNMPKKNTVGDLQISLSGTKVKYDLSDVNCKVSGCKAKCTTPEPAVSTVLKTERPRLESKYKHLDKYNLERVIPSNLHGTLVIGNVEFKNLYVHQARCNIDMLMSYGCTGCNKLPYLVFSASKIVNSGVIKFVSNCTFDTDLFSCTSDPYILNLMSYAEYCNFYIEQQNLTFTIKVDYQFIGDLTRYSLNIGHSNEALSVMASLVQNESFINSLSMSILMYSLIGTIAGVFVKVYNRIMLVRSIKESGKL